MLATPMAIIAVSVLPPKTALNMIARSSAGNARRMSQLRMTRVPSHGFVIAAKIPSGTPTSAATPTATTPTKRVVRAP